MSDSAWRRRAAVGLVSSSVIFVACLGGARPSTGTGLRAGTGSAATLENALGACASTLNAQERALARLFETSTRQRRRRLRCDPVLASVARARALDMATRRFFRHVNPDGLGPNRLVERAGYRLPSNYNRSRRGNNVEVIAAGHDRAEEAWEAWLRSRSHRPHVVGSSDFFREQSDYGVGFASVPGSRYGTYWVLISARHP